MLVFQNLSARIEQLAAGYSVNLSVQTPCDTWGLQRVGYCRRKTWNAPGAQITILRKVGLSGVPCWLGEGKGSKLRFG